MISRKEQIYNRINTYIKKYGIQSFIKMTPHAMDRHLGLNDDQLINTSHIPWHSLSVRKRTI